MTATRKPTARKTTATSFPSANKPKGPTVKVHMTKNKETKGGWARYASPDENPAIGAVYLPPATYDQLGKPDSVTVTVTL